MAYFPTESRLGLKSFANVDTATAVPFGTIVRGADSTSGQGGGEFIYLPGVASTVIGSLVTYNTIKPSTTLAPNTAHLGQPLAVAMAAVATTANFGWYQIAGAAVIKKTAVKVNPGVAIFLSATAGRVFPTATSGKEILNAVTLNAATVASATSTVQVLINRPFAQGQVI
jgi:hypothetical protein